MVTKSKFINLELYFKLCHDHLLLELKDLGEQNLLADSPRCKSFILKGLQRLLIVCIEKNLDIDQALIDLEVQGKLFATDLAYSNKKCSELLELYKLRKQESNDNYHWMHSKQKFDSNKCSDQIASSTIPQAGQVTIGETGEGRGEDDTNWAQFSGTAGI